MGLDMYALRVPKKYRLNQFDYQGTDKDDNPTAVEIAYWRKHNYLHGWMQELYESKGGNKVFNCIPLELTLADLDDLEEAIKTFSLHHTDGFFFGGDYPPDTRDIANYLDFIETARQTINGGDCVYYFCWW